MRYQVTQRMNFIDSHSKINGRINRDDLVKQFGISTPQASIDFKMFIALYPKKLQYDLSLKTYKRVKP